MSLLAAHLEHINYCCEGIDSLPFEPPGIFTNALLSNHDITSLIRDTEAHERALFSVPPPPPPATGQNPDPKPQSRRQTVFNVASGEVTTGPATTAGRAPRRHTAVAAVLGGQLHQQIVRRNTSGGELDIETLLRGAQKLCSVYALPGALDRIPVLRSRHHQLQSTLAYYETKVAEQTQALDTMKWDHWMDDEEEDPEVNPVEKAGAILTEDDVRREEEEVKEMDRKKRELHERLRMMENDLAGLLS
ncbi:DASH complex subunit Spc34 [Zalerion maritima]|uniref:DASH complex subunit SPC34 n=1 Tax=Zalerion maritima TaxID=339359 RepID=A0AAD5RYY0_9PEZI|nr:DASH complex subunit Spc34 [Zalerion maritima]